MDSNQLTHGAVIPSRRKVGGVLALIALVGASVVQAQTAPQNYPSRPIRIVVGFPPGGSSDAVARVLGVALSNQLGQPVIVDNKPGANTAIAAQYVKSQPADGYTLLAASTSFVINPYLQKLNYNPKTDFVPVALVGTVPLVLVTPPQSTAKSVDDLIAQAKAQPSKTSYASYGAGSAGHIATEQMLSMRGAEMLHVPYKGSGPAMVDIMGNQVSMLMATVTASIAAAKDNKVRAIAVSSSKRVPALPSVPTIAESGLAGYELVEWESIQAPAGTPQAVVDKLNAAIRQVVAMPEYREKLSTLGVEADPSKSPADMAKFVQMESDRFGKIIQDRNIKPQ